MRHAASLRGEAEAPRGSARGVYLGIALKFNYNAFRERYTDSRTFTLKDEERKARFLENNIQRKCPYRFVGQNVSQHNAIFIERSFFVSLRNPLL